MSRAAAVTAGSLERQHQRGPPTLPAHGLEPPQRLGVGAMLWVTVRNPLFFYVAVLGLLLASAAHTYVFFLPMIINALVQGG